MKKVLLLTRPICPPWDEASKNFAHTLAKNVKIVEIHILTCGKIKDLPENVIQRSIFPLPKLSFGSKFRLYNFLKKVENIDIVHSLFTPTKVNSFFIKQALQGKNMKVIQTVATLREDIYTDLDFKKILFGDLIVTYSDYAKEKLEKFGFQNVRRIYPGIDLDLHSPASKKPEMMEKFNINENDFVINFTGEFARLGAIDDVVDSFMDLAKEHPNFKLFLACRIKNDRDKTKKEEIERKIKEAGYADRVAFAYDQSYVMADVYNLADISVFPVRDMKGKFDIPLAVIEAMACGKPVIASSLERLKYFLNSENSILINPGDQGALKEKILYLHNNPEARRELGERGMRFARENFDIMKIVKEYEKIYENLVS